MKYQNPNIKWVVYANVPRTLWDEFKDEGLLNQIDTIVADALENAIKKKRGF